MGGLSDYYENILLDQAVGKNPSATRYIALSTATITDATTGSTITEPSTVGTAYARKSTAASDWNNAANGTVTNATTITFPTSTGAWGTITYGAITDNATAGQGNILLWGALGEAQAITTGNVLSFPPGSISFSLD